MLESSRERSQVQVLAISELRMTTVKTKKLVMELVQILAMLIVGCIALCVLLVMVFH
jgi:hypothetical protein